MGGRRRRRTLLMLLGEFLVLVLMAAAGILHASLVSLAYFVGFLWAATWLGMQRPLARAYRWATLSLSSFPHVVLCLRVEVIQGGTREGGLGTLALWVSDVP